MSWKCLFFLASTLVSAFLRPIFHTHCSSARSQLKINGLYMDAYVLPICWTVSHMSSKIIRWMVSSCSLVVQVFGRPDRELTCVVPCSLEFWSPLFYRFKGSGILGQCPYCFLIDFPEFHTFLLQVTYDCSDLCFVDKNLLHTYYICMDLIFIEIKTEFWISLLSDFIIISMLP